MTMFKHQQLARKTSTPRSLKMRARTVKNRSVAHGQYRSLFHSTMRKGRPRKRVLTVDCAVWGALQQTVFIIKVSPQLSNGTERLQKHGRNAVIHRQQTTTPFIDTFVTKVSMNGVVVWSARQFCTMAPLYFPKLI